MQSSEVAKRICDDLTTLLLPLGFKRKSLLFSRPSEDLFHFIQLQGSSGNVVGASKHTVNVAVWVPSLAPNEKPSIPTAHWRCRLGSLCPERSDIWWQSSSEQTARVTAQDITCRVERYALPSLTSLANSRNLLSLWHSGVSPGLTQFQANKLTQALETSLA